MQSPFYKNLVIFHVFSLIGNMSETFETTVTLTTDYDGNVSNYYEILISMQATNCELLKH